ncbi:MAG: alpha/beta fold hydrolase [Rhodospirillales bacterium]|nr:alpha/beta fold hydrolase [Rhodospirillales bacterium]QQS13202.1 MAG: alpha/beta fold hydrolase [Rhodospirillales bacterium]
MPVARANGIDIAYETSGDPADPTILLVMGLGAQLTLWNEAFVEALAGSGLHVVRYDNRDTGLSTDFAAWGQADLPAAIGALQAGRPVATPYTLNDMAADGLALLDHLGIDRAHMLGLSMGGMIAPLMVAARPDRARSMTVMMSTSSRRGLPPGKPEAMKALLTRPVTEDREEIVRHSIGLRRIIGSPGYPEPDDALRAFVERNVDRRYNPQGVGRQYLAVMAGGDRVELLKTLRAPTLVIHGADDPLIHPDCGRDVAGLVPGARFELIPGMGHDLPTALSPSLAALIATHCRAAG